MPRKYTIHPETETVVFNGIRFHRRPWSKYKHLQRYYWPHAGHKYKGVGALHVEVWKSQHGPVPKGMLIHHKDEDFANNRIENLQAVTYSEHGKIHENGSHLVPAHLLPKNKHICIHCGAEYSNFRKTKTKFCRQACEKAYGRKHKLHHCTRICEHCGASFITNRYDVAKCCSRKCGTRHYHGCTKVD